jgi:hypothetical protein
LKNNLVFKAGAIWLILVFFAIVNGIFRERILAPHLGQDIALPVSGITLSALVFMVAYFSSPLFGRNTGKTFILIGAQWVLMTLLFEFIFGHYVAGKPWKTLFQIFNMLKGDLFILVLLVSLLSPYLVSKIRGDS